jgi:hypothetical protein
MDIVITYVDGNDPIWKADYEKYTNVPVMQKRFRDWGTLKYLLRGIEVNMPFIRNVYLVVSHPSQVPEWVDQDGLKIVLHKDIIPEEYLPTFNCNPIEMHLHRIEGLDEEYLSSYGDLPTKNDILRACDISSLDFKAVILFISSSGCAKAETLSLTIGDFIKATRDYHNGESIEEILQLLAGRGDIVPTFYLRRVKTNKFYHTFCSPEASHCIVKYLLSRENLTLEDKLFDFTHSSLVYNFKKVNDKLGLGFVGRYRLFRSHSLRKYHASNIGLSNEYIDALQGRAKTKVHEAYIKTNPKKLKEIYISAMHNVMISDEWIVENAVRKEERPIIIERQEINIVINFSLDGMDYRVE